MSTVVDLSGLGSRGFVINGGAAGDEAGFSASFAGDVNGDGFDDIIIGAPYADIGGTNLGSSYVIYGGPGGFGPIDLGHLSADQGFRIQGTHIGGQSVSGAGDVNGDGFDDVIVATYTHGSLGYGFATAYVVLGKANHPATVDLANLAASDGFKIGGIIENSYYGGFAMRVASAGDVNGDGFDDIIVGAGYANSEKGVAYVIFGKAGPPSDVDVLHLAPGAGFAIQGGLSGDHLGASVASAGDINHDGFDDIIVGAPDNDAGGSNAGQVYVIFGKANGFGTIDVSTLNGTDGFIIRGHNPNDLTGLSVSSAGDINGDGFDDIIIGSPFASTDAAYVIFGKANGFGTVDLNNLPASAGFMLTTPTNDSTGFSVSAAGDLNHDGFDDFIIGNTGGHAYVVFGHAGSFTTLDLTTLAPSAGFILQGGVSTGHAVSGGGDFNHDGFDDLVVTAPFGGTFAGQVYVVSGNATLAGVQNDFNGDGRSDLLWRGDDGRITDWLGQPNGSLAGNGANLSLLVSNDWHIAGSGDFNGDGRTDVLWRNDDGRVTDWLGQQNGSLAGNGANLSLLVSNDWHIAGTGDFNGDGRTDVLWRNDNGRVTDWLGQANGGLVGNGANLSLLVSNSLHIAGTGDFNGDGIDDILWRADDGTVTDWLGQSNGGFVDNGSHFHVTISANWHIVGTGDFNGDGFDDILWRADDGTVTDWLGQASGAPAGNGANFATAVSTDWQIASIGDFNGDRHDDILWRNQDGRLTDWLSQANGALAGNGSSLSVLVTTDWHVQDPFL